MPHSYQKSVFSPIVEEAVPELNVAAEEDDAPAFLEESEVKLIPVTESHDENQGKENEVSEIDRPGVAEEDLPDIETLDYNSDYSVFMAKGVSERLKNRALRQLWRSNPILANVDGLNDYDEEHDSSQASETDPGDEITEDGQAKQAALSDSAQASNEEPFDMADEGKQNEASLKPEKG